MKQNKLEILVGDDAFLDPITKACFEWEYAATLKKNLNEAGYNVLLSLETSPTQVIKRASGFDAIVTDLDYTGGGRGKEGYRVIEEINQMKNRPLLILCTSSDEQKEITEKTKGKIDYSVSCKNGKHKFEGLVETLTNHYVGKGKNEKKPN